MRLLYKFILPAQFAASVKSDGGYTTNALRLWYNTITIGIMGVMYYGTNCKY